jgi:hypothetical protein
MDEAIAKTASKAAEPFRQPPSRRPRIDPQTLEELRQSFLALSGVEKNEFSRWVLRYQIRQTDLTSQNRAALTKILELLTNYEQ